MRPSPSSPLSPSGREARGADRFRAPSAWSALYSPLPQRSLARIAVYRPTAFDHMNIGALPRRCRP
eukprot:CAMPEP_0172605900 /NCGR_PEP_ID=MMETSP1068-20121228/26098_1 /TAXON_ID=35684 /ORGANISM="Pseudopedinella elastica, Strain CCMP716" /LENGTH=65 /DNA_ID=CAMNT_0013408433 /DNA_START=141 /DNA_END=335 /DNA_ORIENTATION=+